MIGFKGPTLTGIHPRSENLIEATRAKERGREFKGGPIDEERLDRLFSEETEDLIRTQQRNRFSPITDGMLRWADLLRPVTTGFRGVEPGPLARWFDNNTFHRTPIVKGLIETDGTVFAKAANLDQLRGTGIKIIFPGPHTLASISKNEHYADSTDLQDDLAHALRKEARNLAAMGTTHLQISEPALVYNPQRRTMDRDELDDHKAAITTIARGLPLHTTVQTFFGDAAPLLEHLLDLPVDAIGIDFYETDPTQLAAHAFDKELSIGCVDSRNSIIETPNQIITLAKRIVEIMEPRTFSLCPNCDLEFVPRPIAENKMASLAEATQAIEGYA